MKDTTSSQKIAKKARQIYRKELRGEVKQMSEIISNAFKPKPKWIPWGAWLWMMGFFIRINRNDKKQ